MPAPTSAVEFLELVKKSGLVQPESYTQVTEATLPPDPSQAAGLFVKRGWLTNFQAKQILAGRYRGFRMGPYIVREQIGQGGMGIVYQGEHEQLRRRVALKVLTGPTAETKNVTLERFLREARAAAALDHPNIVRIHDVGQHGQIHYLVMEYVEGRTIDELITSSGPISAGRAVGYIAQAAAGLLHAHEKGFIHRDIKPGNLMLQADGSVKILDMGLARSFENPNDKLTEQFDAGAVVGTADFISPEQALNDPNIDHRADIYSLGATFYAMVTGQPPFTGNTTQKLMQHQMREAPPLVSIDKTFPSDLSEVIAKMMAKQPHQRYDSMAEVIEALAPWMPDNVNPAGGLSRKTSTGSLRQSKGKAGKGPLSSLVKGTKLPPWAIYAIAAAGVCLVLGIVIWAASQPKKVQEQMGTAAVGENAVTPATKKTPTPKRNTNPKSSAGKSGSSQSHVTGQMIYRFNAAEIPEFRAKYRGPAAVQGTSPTLPNGLTVQCWKPESEGEFTRTIVAGKPAFGLLN
jgi:serine/threonine protein kinase